MLAGRRVVTESVVDAYEPPHRFSFAHLSGPMPVSGEYVVEAAGGGARLTYTLRVRLRGGWSAAGAAVPADRAADDGALTGEVRREPRGRSLTGRRGGATRRSRSPGRRSPASRVARVRVGHA